MRSVQGGLRGGAGGAGDRALMRRERPASAGGPSRAPSEPFRGHPGGARGGSDEFRDEDRHAEGQQFRRFRVVHVDDKMRLERGRCEHAAVGRRVGPRTGGGGRRPGPGAVRDRLDGGAELDLSVARQARAIPCKGGRAGASGGDDHDEALMSKHKRDTAELRRRGRVGTRDAGGLWPGSMGHGIAQLVLVEQCDWCYRVDQGPQSPSQCGFARSNRPGQPDDAHWAREETRIAMDRMVGHGASTVNPAQGHPGRGGAEVPGRQVKHGPPTRRVLSVRRS